ncbi:13128_t:CDS:2 [Funneliformis caledonium]|uniref:13128_t:CDS:1 n=1 Tax=Funneliformis caledonium TaxID=1117310 RepID=A0A9N9GEA9_9GLOM|nr:13128_t:CDS:2 [Funneliformis caledonium]
MTAFKLIPLASNNRLVSSHKEQKEEELLNILLLLDQDIHHLADKQIRNNKLAKFSLSFVDEICTVE